MPEKKPLEKAVFRLGYHTILARSRKNKTRNTVLLHSKFQTSPGERMDTTSTVITPQAGWFKLFRWLEPAACFSLRLACVLLLAAWFINNATDTVRRIVDFYNPLPVWDYWDIVLKLSAYQSSHWSVLWMQHNEHRIVFPELVFAADLLWLHGRMVLPLVTSFLCYLGTWIALSWTVLTDCRLEAFHRAIACLLAGIIVFWEGSVNVLAAPFLLQWPLMQFGAACAFVFLSRVKEARSPGPLLGVIVAATVATYSSGNALVLWPLIVAFALFLRLNKSQLLLLASSAVLNLALYFVGYGRSGALNLQNLLAHPVSTLGFVASYLSMPFGGMKAPSFGVTMGLISLGGTVAFLAVAVRKQLHQLPPAVVLVGYYAMTLLTALITAAGRMGPADEQFGGAKAVRYISVPQMNWGAFVLFCLWMAWSARWPKWIGYLLSFSFAVFLFVYLPKLDSWLSINEDSFAEEQLATLSVESGLRDRDLLSYIHPDLPTLSTGLTILQKARLSIYSHPRSRWLGKPVRSYAPVREFLPGAITEVTPVESGLQLTGWADASQWKPPYRWVMLTDRSGKIVGLGSRIPSGFPRTARSLSTPSSLGWVGFIPERLQPAVIFAYVADARKKNLFPLVNSASVPPIRSVPPAELGVPIRSVEWKSDVGGVAGLIPIHINSSMLSGPVQSSWAGADANTGTITSSVFAAPPNGCLILPVLHGPVGDRVSVTVKDAGTGTAIVDEILHRDDRQQWKLWRLQLKPGEKISVVAKDEGNGWGEWLAVGSPYTCR